MKNKRIWIGLLVLLIGLADLYFSRNLIYNYVYGPYRTDIGNCVRPLKPAYHAYLGLEDSYLSINGRLFSVQKPVYDPSGSHSYYVLTRPAGYVVIKVNDAIRIQPVSDSLMKEVQCEFKGTFVDCSYSTPEEKQLRQLLRDSFGDAEYPIVYFDATTGVNDKKKLAWFQYIVSVVLIAGGLLLFITGFFPREKKKPAAE